MNPWHDIDIRLIQAEHFDVPVLCSEVLDPLTEVECYPNGVVTMIAIPFKDPVYNGLQDISDIPQHTVDEVSHFFDVYKALEHSKTSVMEICSRPEAVNIIRKAVDLYKEAFGD